MRVAKCSALSVGAVVGVVAGPEARIEEPETVNEI